MARTPWRRAPDVATTKKEGPSDMGQVNVNTPGPGEPAPVDGGGPSAGFILGILVAIVIIALLVYFLLFNGGGTTPTNNAGGGGAGPSGMLLHFFG